MHLERNRSERADRKLMLSGKEMCKQTAPDEQKNAQKSCVIAIEKVVCVQLNGCLKSAQNLSGQLCPVISSVNELLSRVARV